MTCFLADENVSHYVVERLRVAGFNVMAIGLTNPGALDSDVLATARHDGRILITEDRDFGEMVVRQRLEVRGVILLELDRLSNVAEAERVVAVVSRNAEKISGNLLVIEPGRVRVRPLRP